jgi:hypothetical protein
MGLWIKNEDGSVEKAAGGGGSGGGGPHDHDYLPLEGGTVAGDLQVDGTIIVKSGGGATNSAIGFNGLDGMGIYSSVQNNYMRFAVSGAQRLGIKETEVVVNNDLQVDGQILATRGSGTAPGLSFAGFKGTGFYPGSTNVATHVNGVWQFVVYDDKVRVIRDLQVDGTITGTLAFGIADGIDTQDVLDRAETATMPALDEEGVATADVESLTVNEVVTALLAKIKELSARIETLEGN